MLDDEQERAAVGEVERRLDQLAGRHHSALPPLDVLAWLEEPSALSATDSAFGDFEVLARLAAICHDHR